MKTISSMTLALVLMAAACGGNDKPANDPSSTTTTTVTKPSGDGAATPSSTGAPAGQCKAAPAIASSVSDLQACMNDCEKLPDTSPPDAKCIPPRVSCKSQCNDKFKK
jgi:hypothetical protein